MHVCLSTYTAWGTHHHMYPHVPTCTYHRVYTYVYMQVPVLPAHARGPMRMSHYGGTYVGPVVAGRVCASAV